MKKFSIPLQTEVSKYIKEKKGWPQTFCDHYAEKFWNHYQASGWKLSSGNSVKDWKACFNAQWQQLKFKEDIDLLNSLTGKTNGMNQVKPINDFERLDAFIDQMRKAGQDVRFEDFGKWYDFMKQNRLILPMTQVQINGLLTTYQGDKQKCRCAAVQLTLDHYVIHGMRISDILKIRERVTG